MCVRDSMKVYIRAEWLINVSSQSYSLLQESVFNIYLSEHLGIIQISDDLKDFFCNTVCCNVDRSSAVTL
jgi:hypothetical protein